MKKENIVEKLLIKCSEMKQMMKMSQKLNII